MGHTAPSALWCIYDAFPLPLKNENKIKRNGPNNKHPQEKRTNVWWAESCATQYRGKKTGTCTCRVTVCTPGIGLILDLADGRRRARCPHLTPPAHLSPRLKAIASRGLPGGPSPFLRIILVHTIPYIPSCISDLLFRVDSLSEQAPTARKLNSLDPSRCWVRDA